MTRMSLVRNSITFIAVGIGLLVGRIATACPFCPPSQPTYAEHIAECDVAVLCQWQKVVNNEATDTSVTTLKVREFIRKTGVELKADDAVTLPFNRGAQPGDLFVLIGKRVDDSKPDQKLTGKKIEWLQILDASETSYQYMRQAPSPERPAPERLKFYLRFLESADSDISNDAFAEFAKAEYKDVAALASSLPRDKIRGWLKSDQTMPIRKGFYGLLLGLCGTLQDADWLESQFLPPPAADEVRLSSDGMMAGYVLLRGPEGMRKLVDRKLRDPQALDAEAWAVVSVLRFFWEFGGDLIPRDQLKTSLRLALDRPELADRVIPDLARWKDWSVLNRLEQSIGKPPFETPGAKRQILEFLKVCAKDRPRNPDDPLPDHVVAAEQILKSWEARDPEFFKRPDNSFFR